MAIACKRVFYRGQVQGVGFRYTARAIASAFAVAGYVRNLSDGRVELLVEGEAAEVDRFLNAVAQRMASHIHEQSASDEPAEGHTSFDIRL